MALTDDDLRAYDDGILVVEVPSYLRRFRNRLLFEAPKIDKSGRQLLSFGALTARDVAQAERFVANMMHVIPSIWQGVSLEINRQGKAVWLPNGHELLSTRRHIKRSVLRHYLAVLYPMGPHFIDVSIIGSGNLEDFDRLCQSLIGRIRLSKGEVGPPVKRSRSAAGGLGRADKARLSQTLKGLPPELAYLRKPILAIAKEDQDLLSSGEGDIGPIERALQKVSKGGEIGPTAEAHARALHQWLTGLPDANGAWAAPLGFVEGCLRGCALFGADTRSA